MMSASGHVLLVTGASRGIGAATARRAAADGWRVAVNYNTSAEHAAQVVAAIQGAGGDAHAYQADVSQSSECERLLTEIATQMGSVSGLVNNVGGTGGAGPFDDNVPEKIERVFALNTFSAFHCTRFAARQMNAGGVIVNVTTQAATYGGAYLSPYAAAKAAVSTMTISASKELASRNIRVNAVSPGVIEAGEFLEYPQERKDAMMATLPLGRVGQPEEVAEAICWLLSDAASYVTGSILPVCGGR